MCVMICMYIWMIIQKYVVDKMIRYFDIQRLNPWWFSFFLRHSVSQWQHILGSENWSSHNFHSKNSCIFIHLADVVITTCNMVLYEQTIWIWYILWVKHSFRKIWCIHLDLWSFLLVFRRPWIVYGWLPLGDGRPSQQIWAWKMRFDKQR